MEAKFLIFFGVIIILVISVGCSQEFEKVVYNNNYPIDTLTVKAGQQTIFSNGPDIKEVISVNRINKNQFFCYPLASQDYICNADFKIKISEQAANRFAEVSKDYDIISHSNGQEYLSEKLYFYVDGELIDEMHIAPELKGESQSVISIPINGYGNTESEAIKDTESNLFEVYNILRDKK